MPMRLGIAAMLSIASMWIASPSHAAEPEPLALEAKIPLGAVEGRIDHMAIDAQRQRLWLAELGNGSVSVIDLKERKVVHRIGGLKEPQGIGYVAATDTVYVASGGDGSVRLFRAADYAPLVRIDLGNDADNVRVDNAANRVFVGYGAGGIAVIDPAGPTKIGDIALKAHPESFQLETDGNRIFANVPNEKAVAVLDRAAARQISSWPMRAGANFPMAIDHVAQRVLVVFRNPARLGVFAMTDGAPVANVEACGDSDDVFVDAKRHRVYASCGDGHIDVFDTQAGYRRIGTVATISGARTALFAPDVDRFILAVRARLGEPAAIWLFRPLP